MNTLDVVDNICVYGDSTKDYIIAIILPNERTLIGIGKQLGKHNSTFQELCDDKEVTKFVEKRLAEHGRRSKLSIHTFS